MHSAPPAELLDQESLELSLLVAPDGTILWRDARALAQLGVDADDRLHDVVSAGMEPKLDELLSRGRRERVRPWELALESNGALVTYAFSAVPYDGAVLLVGSRIPEQFSDTLRQVSDAMGEILTLNRQVLRQKSELSDRHDELTKIDRELEDSNRGVLVLHSELAGQAEALQRTSEVKGRVVANVEPRVPHAAELDPRALAAAARRPGGSAQPRADEAGRLHPPRRRGAVPDGERPARSRRSSSRGR